MNAIADPIRVAARLGRLEPRFAEMHRRFGPPPWLRTRNSFRSLSRAIVHQQVAGSAAAAVFDRLRKLYAPAPFPTPRRLLDTPFETLRSTGLSRQKATYLRALAAAYVEGRVRPRQFAAMSDDEIVRRLTAIHGIGPWTAEIFLMFDLLRGDVLPLGDYGIQQGMALLHELEELPSRQEMVRIAEPWRPHRSQACWYLWRLLEASRR